MKIFITLFLFLFSILIFSQTTLGEYTIDNAKVNTKYSDFGTSFFGTNRVVFASPKDNTIIARKTWSGNDQPFLDLYIGVIDEDGRIIDKKRIVGDVNNRYHEGVVAFTKDLKTVYFSANNYTEKHKAKKDSTGVVNIQMYKATLGENGAWHNVIKLPFNSDEFSTGHPALNKDDTKLYFVSDRLGTIGKTDIFVVAINEDGSYGEPKNLGDKINTEKREMFPFISGDNILYFSSNGHLGYGGLDVFASKLFDSSVSDPINLETPVNSVTDDFAFIINDSIDKGYFSSNRENGKGDDDIYSFVSFPPINIEGKQIVSGVVIDKESLELIPQAVVILQNADGIELARKNITVNQTKNRSQLNTKTSNITSNGGTPDIKIVKTVDNPVPDSGEEVEFTIEVTNTGTNKSTDIKIADIIPEGYQYVTDDGVGKYNPETDILTLPALAEGEKVTIKIKAITPLDSVGKNSRKNITAITGDVSNVKINRKVSNLFPQANEEVTFTIEVENRGTNAVTGIKVSDILPKGYVYVTDDGEGKYQSRVDLLTLPTLREGEKTTIKIKAISPENSLNQDHRKSVSVVSGDLKNIKITRKVSSLFPQANEEVSFTVQITNNGSKKAKGVKIADIIPEGYIYVSDDSDQTYQSDIDMLILPKLAKGETKTIIIKALAPSNNLNQKVRQKIATITGKISDIRVYKRVDNLFPQVNDEVEFTIEVENNGTNDARGVKISDILPKGYKYIRDDAVGVYQPDTDLLVFSKLKVGEKRVIKIKAKVIKNFTVDDDAFNFDVKSNTDYKIVVESPGFINGEASFTTSNDTDVNIKLPIKLEPELRVADEKIMVNINTIYFDYGKWNIRTDAAKELDKVIAVMKEHPSINIEAGSHTDSRSREAFNKRLSKKRAKSTRDYIIAGGIDPNRIVYKGYGEMQLVNGCSSFVKCTEAEHQLNRRTEFVIVNDDQKFSSSPARIEVLNISKDNDENVNKINVNGVIENDSLVSGLEFIKFKPVYYKYDAWSLSNDELVQIDRVIQTMNRNPNLIIQVNVHTDAKNLESYNQKFSDKRAKTIVDYMLSKGIDTERVSGKGFGEMILANHCSSFVNCNEEKQQANRRVEFMVIEGNRYPETETTLKYDNETYLDHNPIYFDFDKYAIRKDAAYELNRIVTIMKGNLSLKIIAESHTDSQNLESYNQVLSEKRANATKNYLVSKGISPSRIKIKGYGEMRLTNNCSSFVKCTPEKHQANRRTEFKVIKM